jgi:hypothetical protein
MVSPRTLQLLPQLYAICRLDSTSEAPAWALRAGDDALRSITRTNEELSIVCPSSDVPADAMVRREDRFRALKVVGPLDFALTGVIGSLVAPLATSKVSVFTISTFDTDYLLVRDHDLPRALAALESAGHRVRT